MAKRKYPAGESVPSGVASARAEREKESSWTDSDCMAASKAREASLCAGNDARAASTRESLASSFVRWKVGCGLASTSDDEDDSDSLR
jgi:hypothetical protein